VKGPSSRIYGGDNRGDEPLEVKQPPLGARDGQLLSQLRGGPHIDELGVQRQHHRRQPLARVAPRVRSDVTGRGTHGDLRWRLTEALRGEPQRIRVATVTRDQHGPPEAAPREALPDIDGELRERRRLHADDLVADARADPDGGCQRGAEPGGDLPTDPVREALAALSAFFISDGTGITAETFGNAILACPLDQIPISGHNSDKIREWFNTACFNRNTSQQLANNLITLSPRFGGIRGDSYNSWDASLIKDTYLREGVQFELRFEALNVFNQVNFANPNTDLTSPPVRPLRADTSERSRVRRLQWRLQPLYQIGGPRSIQLALKLQF